MARRRTLTVVAALAGLVALVAVASRGHSPTGGGTAHAVSWRLIWEFVVVGWLALFIICMPLLVWTVHNARMSDPMGHAKRQQRAVRRIVGLLILLAAFGIALW